MARAGYKAVRAAVLAFNATCQQLIQLGRVGGAVAPLEQGQDLLAVVAAQLRVYDGTAAEDTSLLEAFDAHERAVE